MLELAYKAFASVRVLKNNYLKHLALLCLLSLLSTCAAQQESPQLKTRWTELVTAENVHPEYPRPQFVREDWLNLNGLWNYAITSLEATLPAQFEGEILVPFPVESVLSGVAQNVNDKALWYQRSFRVPEQWSSQRIVLHFGAVDWDTTVWLNGEEFANHKGGYDAFSFDITDLVKASGEQELVVRVLDPSDAGTQARGKQVREPKGIWYSSSTGIWQTVWLEPIPETHISGLKMTPDIDNSVLRLELEHNAKGAETVLVSIFDEGKIIAETNAKLGQQLELAIPDPKLWSPDSPFLYDIAIKLLREGRVIDELSSYFGMRDISVKPDDYGVFRLHLNHEPLFHYGLLDQGFWPDGLYTAPNDEALRYDIEVTKQLGFNSIRKHVKVEPARWYYWADKLGVLVWQDMPSGDAFVGKGQGEISRLQDSAEQFERELEQLVLTHYNHPSIVMWVPFNEGWGQYDTVRLTTWLKELDPTRLVNPASGWNDMAVGDVLDIHSYPGPDAPPLGQVRASVLGEYGGLGLAIEGHTWQQRENFSYQDQQDRNALTVAYLERVSAVRELIETQGLAAAIFTQTSDVEIEVNGMMTYDREIIKMDIEKVFEANQSLYTASSKLRLDTFIPSAELSASQWRYITEKPEDDWIQAAFDDTEWRLGQAGFGTQDAPASVVGTLWTSDDLWLRKRFWLDSSELSDPYLRIHHIENAAIYLNGEQILRLPLSTGKYVVISLNQEARALLKEGDNLLAVHAQKPVPGFALVPVAGQYIDIGFYNRSIIKDKE